MTMKWSFCCNAFLKLSLSYNCDDLYKISYWLVENWNPQEIIFNTVAFINAKTELSFGPYECK